MEIGARSRIKKINITSVIDSGSDFEGLKDSYFVIAVCQKCEAIYLETQPFHICGKMMIVSILASVEVIMNTSTSIRIDQTLYEQARSEALVEHRTIAGQIEYWARVGRAALDNPDLPVSFIAESLASMAEPRSEATDFVPRSAADELRG
ncbi:ParD-like antitoxin of type II ParDE toxin-antitoxin system [Nitrosomonas eutropha]|uniref:ParD-like antitoxin of type II ParDE toxin-antitoxin system n=2 Tax=Nitrosomonas eutropha TaxID=916 RepID=A0ABX5M6F8_9PROT|nr:ParD-like antitoxin of type II ParDE toxin-antitoxin system [Nitrosomonas eutropha]